MGTVMKWMLLAAVGALASAGCVVEPGDAEDEVGEAGDAIINGFEVFAPETIGVVKVLSPTGLSSGSVLKNQWVLTVAHGVGTASDTTVELPSPVNLQVKTVSQVIKHPTLDIALLKLSTPLSLPTGLLGPWSTTGYQKTISTRTTDSMSGLSITCAGYGRGTFDGVSGQLRWANFTVGLESGSPFFIVQSNFLGQVPWRGDSGGPCYPSADPLASEIVGVMKQCQFGTPPGGVTSVNYCRSTSAENFRTWVLSHI